MSLAAPTRPSTEQIWGWLRDVADPEIPVLSVVDLGIVREAAWSENGEGECLITITPTYSGCPAMATIEKRIREEMQKHGIAHVQLRVRLSPPWTTDWLTPAAQDALRAFGIAPPAGPVSLSNSALPIIANVVPAPHPQPACPRCGSARTQPISQFGSTLCKALYRCEACLEPFDYFKCH